MDQKRYFIGITLPEELSETVSRLQLAGYDERQMLYPLVPHITVLPPGALELSHPLYLIPKLGEAARNFLPFTLKLTEPAMFDQRVLYVAAESNELTRLQERLVSLLPEKIRAAVYTGRSFTPHLTIAQAKQHKQLPSDLVDDFTKKLNKLCPQSFSVTNLSVFTWQKPRHYTVEPL